MTQQYDMTQAARIAMRRYAQGEIHGRQGRTDLYGQCPHYDAGFEAAQDVLGEETLDNITFTAV